MNIKMIANLLFQVVTSKEIYQDWPNRSMHDIPKRKWIGNMTILVNKWISIIKTMIITKIMIIIIAMKILRRAILNSIKTGNVSISVPVSVHVFVSVYVCAIWTF